MACWTRRLPQAARGTTTSNGPVTAPWSWTPATTTWGASGLYGCRGQSRGAPSSGVSTRVRARPYYCAATRYLRTTPSTSSTGVVCMAHLASPLRARVKASAMFCRGSTGAVEGSRRLPRCGRAGPAMSSSSTRSRANCFMRMRNSCRGWLSAETASACTDLGLPRRTNVAQTFGSGLARRHREILHGRRVIARGSTRWSISSESRSCRRASTWRRRRRQACGCMRAYGSTLIARVCAPGAGRTTWSSSASCPATRGRRPAQVRSAA